MLPPSTIGRPVDDDGGGDDKHSAGKLALKVNLSGCWL